MDVRLTAFAAEVVKIAAERDKKHRGYLGAMAASAPFAAASSLSEVPKGWVDKYVDQSIRGVEGKAEQSSFRRGVARAVGRFGPSIVTTPVFVSGIRDLQSGDKKRKKKGLAKVVGSGVALSAMKGGIEAGVEHADEGKKAVWKAVKGVAGARGIVGAATAVGAVSAAAAAAKPAKKGEKKGIGKKYVLPAAVGLVGGAGKGAFEEAYKTLTDADVKTVAARWKRLKTPEGIRGVGAAAGGRAAAGALGVVALSEIMRRFMPKEKKAAAETPLGPTAGVLYDQTRAWAKDKNDAEVYAFYTRVTADGTAERSPSRRAAYYALYDDLKARGRDLPAPKMRDDVSPKSTSSTPAALVAFSSVAIAPTVASLAVSKMPPTERDLVLSEALDRLFVQNSLTRGEAPALGPWVDVGKKTLHVREKELPGILAHEIGHVTGNKLRLATMHPVAEAASVTAMAFSVMLPLVAVGSTIDSSFTSPEDLKARARLIEGVGIVAAALQLPGVAEEAIASGKGFRMLRRAGASTGEAAGKMLAHAGPGFLSYAVPVALPFLVAAYLKGKARQGEKTAEAFAPGIPKRSVEDVRSPAKPEPWRFVVQSHPAVRAGDHLDLRLGDPKTGHAHSWATKKELPQPGERPIAIYQQPTHTTDYMNFRGPLTSGYGRTKKGKIVKPVVDEKAEVLQADNDFIRFNTYGKGGHQEYVLVRSKKEQEAGKATPWFLSNVTKTKERLKDLPFSKPKYRDIAPGAIDLSNDDQLMAAKLDGGHNTFLLEAKKRPRIFSYREPKERKTGVLEHSHKVPSLYNSRVPKEVDGKGTIARGELYARDKTGKHPLPVETVTGMINAGVWKSREMQSIHGRLRPALFDVVKFKGKDMASAPYSERLEALKTIRKHMPQFELPDMALGKDEKAALLDAIQKKVHPSTHEGVVLWNLHNAEPPTRAKFTVDHDVYIRGFTQAVDIRGEKKDEAGAFTYSMTPDGPIVGRIGTGFSRELRQDMWKRKEVYTGAVAKVVAEKQSAKLGVLVKPRFSAWHSDKSPETFWTRDPVMK